MQNIQLPVAQALGLTIFLPEWSEEKKLPLLPEVARRVLASLALADIGSLLLTSKTWRTLSLAVLQRRYQHAGSFVDALFTEGCSIAALRVAQKLVQAPCRSNLIFRCASWCIQKDYPDQIPQYFTLTLKHNPEVIKDRRWSSIKAALAEGGNLMPLLCLVIPQMHAIMQVQEGSERNMLLRLEYGYVKSCWANGNLQKKREKMAKWLNNNTLSPKELFQTLLQMARVLMDVQRELQVKCEDIVSFILDLELDKEKKVDRCDFLQILVEETASHPHFAEYCITGFLQWKRFDTARAILQACLSMSADKKIAFEENIDIEEAKVVSCESYEQDHKKKKLNKASLDDEEFFNALDELDLCDRVQD